MAGEALLKTIREAAVAAIPSESRTDLIYGSVTSASPLKVSVENRFEVNEDMLILSPWCFDKNIKISLPGHSHNATVGSLEIPAHEHVLKDDASKKTDKIDAITLSPDVSINKSENQEISIKIWSGLVVGDKVALLRVASGQQYVVLFKAGE